MNNNSNTETNNKSQKLITDFFKPADIEIKVEIVKGYNHNTGHFHCLECGIDMGNYPGQLCRKSFCDGIY